MCALSQHTVRLPVVICHMRSHRAVPFTDRFMRHLVREVKKMHADTQPLKVFHFGGDEVARGAWTESPACAAMSLTERLKQRFVQEVAKIVQGEGLDIAGWEDGLMSEGNVPFNRSLFPNNEVYGYAWQNIWEWGGGSRAYELANRGYKVKYCLIGDCKMIVV